MTSLRPLKRGGLYVGLGNIYLKPGHGYAYLHELLRYIDAGRLRDHHPEDLNKLDPGFWKKPFGRKLAEACRDIFGHKHPIKQRVLSPNQPKYRTKMSPCFAGARDRP